VGKFRANRLQYHVPGAESYLDVVNRLRPFVESLFEGHQGQEILIVGHRAANRMLIGLLLDCPLEEAVRLNRRTIASTLLKETVPHHCYFANGEIKEGLVFEGTASSDPSP